MIDLDKAADVLRAEGLEVVAPGGRNTGGWTPEERFRADGRYDGLHCILVTDRVWANVGGVTRSADDMEYVAAELLRAAHICRRIEAECQKTEAP